MSDNLTAALQISLVGMSFVLATLALLWQMMALLVRLTRDPAEPPAAAQPVPAAPLPAVRTGPAALAGAQQPAALAAAAAVAVALASQQASQPDPAAARPVPQPASAWQAAMRAQLLKQRNSRR